MPKTTSEEVRCRACGRLRPASAIERALGFRPTVPTDAPHDEPVLFSVDPFEERAIRAATLPAWKGKARDARLLREALATSISITGDEKLAVLEALPKLSQEQVENVSRILREGREKFEALNRRHREKLAHIEDEYARAIEALPIEELGPDDTVAEAALAGADRGTLIRTAIDPLLRSLGPGDAARVFRTLLERLAAQIESDGGNFLTGFLPELFAPVLRDPAFNPNAQVPAKDAEFLDALVRPTLSRLRAAHPATLVRLRGIAYRASLVLVGPERPRGPVRQPYQIGVQMHPHWTDAIDTHRYRSRLLSHFRTLVIRAPYVDVLPIEGFGPLGVRAARAVEIRGYTDAGQRRVLRLKAALTLLDRILPLLYFEEKAAFLASLLRIELVPRSSSRRFSDWFLEAITLQTAEEDAYSTDAVLAMLPMLDELRFTERVAIVAHLRQLPPAHPDRQTLSVVFRSALGGPPVTPAEMFVGPALSLESLLSERVLHHEAFIQALERDLTDALASSA